MQITLTKKEVEKLVRTISWVNHATQDSPEGRKTLEDIVMKLSIGLKSAKGGREIEVNIVDV
jgi:hypothetical protein